MEISTIRWSSSERKANWRREKKTFLVLLCLCVWFGSFLFYFYDNLRLKMKIQEEHIHRDDKEK